MKITKTNNTYCHFIISTLAAIITSLLVISIAYASPAKVHQYNDVPKGHWAYAQINQMTKDGFLYGYDNGSFKPNNTITKGEFIAIISRIYGVADKTKYEKSTSGLWYETYMNEAFVKGWLSDQSMTANTANQSITRAEAVRILFDANDIDIYEYTLYDDTELCFTDFNAIEHDPLLIDDGDYAYAAYLYGISEGYDDGSYRKDSYMTRAEMCVFLTRAKDLLSPNNVIVPLRVQLLNISYDNEYAKDSESTALSYINNIPLNILEKFDEHGFQTNIMFGRYLSNLHELIKNGLNYNGALGVIDYDTKTIYVSTTRFGTRETLIHEIGHFADKYLESCVNDIKRTEMRNDALIKEGSYFADEVGSYNEEAYFDEYYARSFAQYFSDEHCEQFKKDCPMMAALIESDMATFLNT